MGSKWNYIAIGELITLQRGHDLPSQDRKEGCIPIMGSSGLTGFHNEAKTQGPGVVVGRSGNSMGAVSYSESDYWPLNTCLYITDFKGNDVRYIYYILQQINFDQFNSGSAQKSLNRNAVYPFKIYSTTNKLEQRRIGEFLSQFEEKIDLNKRLNQTLEQMAQALFKSWFVDFDPVFDNLLASVDFKLENLETSLPDELIQKAQRRLVALNSLHNAAEIKASLIALAHELQALSQTKEATQSAVQAAETPVKANLNANPSILAQHANTHAHFPNEFEHNEQLGWIPKGWVVDSLSFLSNVSSGKRPPSKSTEANDFDIFPVWGGNGIKWYTSSTLLDEKFIITGRVGTLGTVYKVFEPSWVSDNALIIQPKNNNYFEYIYQCLNDFDIESLNSGSTQPLVTQTAIKKIEILVPECLLLLKEFQRVCSSFENKHQILEKEIAQLTKLRDTLLPKLISGELQIPDVVTDEEVVD